MKRRRHVVGSLVVVAALAFLPVGAQGGPSSIKIDDLREMSKELAEKFDR